MNFEDLPLSFRMSCTSRKGGTLVELTNAIWDGEEPRVDASHRAAVMIGDYVQEGVLKYSDGAWRKKK